MLNRTIIMGRLTRDPELRHTQSGTPVASFSLAVERDFKDKSTGEKATDFFDVVAWRNSAEFVSRFSTKAVWPWWKGGSRIGTGRIGTAISAALPRLSPTMSTSETPSGTAMDRPSNRDMEGTEGTADHLAGMPRRQPAMVALPLAAIPRPTFRSWATMMTANCRSDLRGPPLRAAARFP